jgi:hypothetical protein
MFCRYRLITYIALRSQYVTHDIPITRTGSLAVKDAYTGLKVV